MPHWQRNGWQLSNNGGNVKNRVELELLHDAITQNGRIDIKWVRLDKLSPASDALKVKYCVLTPAESRQGSQWNRRERTGR